MSLVVFTYEHHLCLAHLLTMNWSLKCELLLTRFFTWCLEMCWSFRDRLLAVKYVINVYIFKNVKCKCKLKCELWQEAASFDIRKNKSTLSYSKSLELEFCPGNLTKHDSSGNILSDLHATEPLFYLNCDFLKIIW